MKTKPWDNVFGNLLDVKLHLNNHNIVSRHYIDVIFLPLWTAWAWVMLLEHVTTIAVNCILFYDQSILSEKCYQFFSLN